MTPVQSKELTRHLENAAVFLLKLQIYRKPDDLARRFGLPLPVVRYWWRQTDQETSPVEQSKLSPREVKSIRKASQTLESWEKHKRNRPQCGAKLAGGKRCKRSVAIRPPEAWGSGALADRCRLHGGLSKKIIRTKKERAEDD